jgi:hypothetical protein
MGWYRNDTRPDEYRLDLPKLFEDDPKFAFASDGQVTMRVRKDKQAWYAYRRTPSGHYFGIGASGPPPSQWFFDDSAEPHHFPQPGARGWSDSMSELRAEWQSEPKI